MVQRKSKLKIKQISTPICDVREEPNQNSNLETQFLYGEEIEIIDKSNNTWILCKSLSDNYEGWIKKHCLGKVEKKNFRVSSVASFVYQKPDVKSKIISTFYFNSKLFVKKHYNKSWAKINYNGTDAYIYKNNLVKLVACNKINLDWVEITKLFLNSSYMWGGKSQLGLDCSALLQLAIQSFDILFPRNSSQQYQSDMLKPTDKIKKGTVIFWDGHVAIAIDKENIIHANAYHMKVAIESFKIAKKRIQNDYGKLLGFKKLITVE